MNQNINLLFERVAELTGYDTHGTRTKNTKSKKYYKKDWLRMDYNSYYGGYNLRIVLTTTGEQEFDSLSRKTKKEMEAYLRGLIKGLTYKK